MFPTLHQKLETVGQPITPESSPSSLPWMLVSNMGGRGGAQMEVAGPPFLLCYPSRQIGGGGGGQKWGDRNKDAPVPVQSLSVENRRPASDWKQQLSGLLS